MKILVTILAKQTNFVDRQSFAQHWPDMRLKAVNHVGGDLGCQLPRQGQVKAKRVKNIRVTPRAQIFFLCIAQVCYASAGQLRIAWRCSERVKSLHTACGESGKFWAGPCWCDGNKPAKRTQTNLFYPKGGLLTGKDFQMVLKAGNRCAFGQLERWFQRAVEPVFARRGGELSHRKWQIGKARVRHPAACFGIPTQPLRAEIRQARASFRCVIHRISYIVFYKIKSLAALPVLSQIIVTKTRHNCGFLAKNRRNK